MRKRLKRESSMVMLIHLFSPRHIAFLFPEIHRFALPEGCHWNDVSEVAANVGAALQRPMCHSACNIGSDSLLMQFARCLAF